MAVLMLWWDRFWEPFPLGLKEKERGSGGRERGNFLTSRHE